MIAALYVLPDGPYANREDIDLWPETRDARLYAGPWPVVAHPPCERWGWYWSGGPSPLARRRELGDDGGCFKAAILHVTTFGGVLEHPEGTHAWRKYSVNIPPRRGGWVAAGVAWPGCWTCCVEQGHYGHLAAKATWLFVARIPGSSLPELRWGKSGKILRLDEGYHSKEERARATKTGVCQRLSRRQRTITPEPFAELLLELARLSVGGSA
jgi:hypothetical protein